MVCRTPDTHSPTRAKESVTAGFMCPPETPPATRAPMVTPTPQPQFMERKEPKNPLRHFIEFRKKLMLIDRLFNII